MIALVIKKTKTNCLFPFVELQATYTKGHKNMVAFLISFLAVTTLDYREKFVSEYPAQAEILKQRLRDVRGIAEPISNHAEKKYSMRPVRFATIRNAYKMEIELNFTMLKGHPSGRAYVTCGVGSHCFRLEKDAGAQNYVVTAYGDSPIDNAVIGDYTKYIYAAWSIQRRDITEWMRLPNFKLIEAGELREDGRSLVEVRFESGSNPSTLADFHVVFDPTLNWAIKRSTVSLRRLYGRTAKSKVEYAKLPNDKFYMSEVEHSNYDAGVGKWKFKDIEFVSTPSTDFTMEYYGLVDPATKQQNRNGIGWAIWASLCVVVVALFLSGRWLRRLASQ